MKLTGDKKKAWEWFSKYIRLKYADKYGYCICVTCFRKAKWEKDGMQAGHFVQGRGNAVLLHEELVYPQCYSCNCGADKGKPFEFTKYMLSLGYTMEQLDAFQQLKHGTCKVPKYYWKEKAEEYEAKFKSLEAAHR